MYHVANPIWFFLFSHIINLQKKLFGIMKIWITEIKALDPKTNELKTWFGDNVQAPTMKLAQEWCDKNYKGYLKVIGELVAEIPCKEGSCEADFSKMIDYDNIQNN